MEKKRLQDGHRPEQIKPLRILRNEGEKEYLGRWIEQ
jgi:hypothetical protein